MGIEEGQVGEVHHQLIPLCTADGDVGAVGLAVLAVGHGDLAVDISTVDHADVGAAVAVLVQGQDDHAPPRQLHRVGGAGFPVILIAVEQQHTGGRGLGRGPLGHIELVGQLPCPGGKAAGGDGDGTASGLNPVGKPHAGEDAKDQHQKHRQKEPGSFIKYAHVRLPPMNVIAGTL